MQFTLSNVFLALAMVVPSLVAAAPADVFSPPILTPNASTIWPVGSQQNVTWDASGAPANISNGAAVFLRQANAILFNDMLAEGFDLRSGSVDITVPNVAPGSDYSIVLFGDSGNNSPMFTITA